MMAVKSPPINNASPRLIAGLHMTTLEKAYQPHLIENHWYQVWDRCGYFSPSAHAKETYCIMLPPPNVTGSLHMGHGFSFTLMDILIRYERMMGKKTLWQGGSDHAGIATQMVVERNLHLENTTREALGREKFIEKIWQWKKTSGDHITHQLRRLGASIDWTKERFTMDPSLSFAVSEVFIRLYEEGLIYRGKRLVNWDPILLTALSDLEVMNEEEEGKLWYIRYPFQDNSDLFLTVATTRPETLFGDKAVAVHPKDERYQTYIGKHLALPLTNRSIPIIADEAVDPLFGTGCVKVTPAHDANDYAIALRHALEPLNIFTRNAHLNENVPLAYQGLERFKARTKVVADLETSHLIEKVDTHKIKIPKGDRSQAIVEPLLTEQWYVQSKPLAKKAIEAVQSEKIRFIPENWSKTYFQWMDNIQDWCISRQLWWGHRIPIWYDEKHKAYAGHTEEDVRNRHQLPSDMVLTQDEDVLDTWFSSALWPFSSLGWPKSTEDLNTFFPTQTLVTGFDIIFFWVARMIMMSLKFTEQIPFSDVYITGLIRDAEGQKMSKSKGNVLDPIDLIDGISLSDLTKKRTHGLMQPAMAEKIERLTRKEFPHGISAYGTDALRFTYCALASYTRDIRFDINRLAGYRHFCNKLWNASRYVLINTENYVAGETSKLVLSLPDQWIRSRLQQTIREAHAAIKDYRFDLLAHCIYEFTWNEFCDWYLELSKPLLTNPHNTIEERNGTCHTLLSVLEILLRLIHPIMPFISEEIWQRIIPRVHKEHAASIMITPYPLIDDSWIDEKATQSIAWIKQVIISIRTLRSEMNIAPSKNLKLLLRKGSAQDREYANEHTQLLLTLGKLESIAWLDAKKSPPQSASAFLNELEIFIPIAGIINQEEEIARLKKEMITLEKDRSLIQAKLQNLDFVNKAPATVVNKERQRLEEINILLTKLREQVF